MKTESTRPGTALNLRTFLQSLGVGAGLVVAWSSGARASGVSGTSSALKAAAQGQQAPPPPQLDAYLKVNEDGSVTLLTGKIEFGQGIMTGFRQIVAEELSIPFEQVEAIWGITSLVPNDGTTAGSSSTRRTGLTIRRAAAEMREWLKELGAEELGATPADVTVENGVVSLSGDAASSVDFAALAAGQSALREVREDVPLKDPSEYTIVGQSVPRYDVPAKVNGEMKYGIDAELEGMVYGKIVRPPARGATLASIDFSDAESMPGVVGVFHDGEFAGLAAERLQQAEAALAAVKAEWNLPETTTTHETIYDLLRSTPDDGRVLGIEEGETPPDPTDALASAATTIKATFKSPYISHSPIEPKASLANVTDEGVEIWTSTQSPFNVRAAVATILERPEEEVVVTTLMDGGAFGSKVQPDSEVEAARLSAAFGRPVKVIWTRKEEFQDARFRPAMLIDIEAGLDAEGNLAAWSYDLYSAAYFPENAAEPTSCAASQAANAAELYDIPVSLTNWYQSHSPLPPYFWRVNGAGPNTFAREVVIDELAEAAGVDPVTFRAKMLGNNPRMKAVMDAVSRRRAGRPASAPPARASASPSGSTPAAGSPKSPTSTSTRRPARLR